MGAWIRVGGRLAITVGGLVNGTEYAFEIRGLNAIGPGAVATATTRPGAQPSAPTGLVAEPGDGEMRLSWEAPVDDGGWEVTGYEFRYRPVTSSEFGEWTDGGPDPEATVAELTNDVDYVFEVRAVNSVGGGDAATVIAAPWVASVPDAPALTAAGDDGLVELSWGVPDNGGAAIERYEYRWRLDGDVFGEWIDGGLAVRLTVEDLANGVTHHFEVRAVNEQGPGPAGTASAVPAGLPGEPKVSARAGDALVELSWEAPDNGGAAIERYEYRYGEEGALGEWIDGRLERSVVVRGLVNGVLYGFEVRAVNVRGGGPHGSRGGDADARSGCRCAWPWLGSTALAGRRPGRWWMRWTRGSAGPPITPGSGARRDGASGAGRQDVLGTTPLVGWGGRLRWTTVASAGKPERWGWPAGWSGGWPIGRWRAAVGRGVAFGQAWRRRAAGRGRSATARLGFGSALGPAARLWSGWGQFAYSGIGGEGSVADIDANVATGTVGADFTRGRMMLGVAASMSRGSGGFRLQGDGYPDRAADDVEATLAGIYPYARFAGDTLAIWGLVGRAAGSMSMTGEDRSFEADLGALTGAVGVRGELPRAGGIDLAWKTDALGMRMATVADGDDEGLVAWPSRLRLLLEASHSTYPVAGGTLALTAEVGGRYEGGEDGRGAMEVGGSVRFAGAKRITLEARVRGLLVGGADGLSERGARRPRCRSRRDPPDRACRCASRRLGGMLAAAACGMPGPGSSTSCRRAALTAGWCSRPRWPTAWRCPTDGHWWCPSSAATTAATARDIGSAGGSAAQRCNSTPNACGNQPTARPGRNRASSCAPRFGAEGLSFGRGRKKLGTKGQFPTYRGLSTMHSGIFPCSEERP